jgi:hypothetical protein
LVAIKSIKEKLELFVNWVYITTAGMLKEVTHVIESEASKALRGRHLLFLG